MKNETSLNHQPPPFGKQMLADAVCRPILFSTPMVNAIRKGDKLMTRRIVKENIPIGNWNETKKDIQNDSNNSSLIVCCGVHLC